MEIRCASAEAGAAFTGLLIGCGVSVPAALVALAIPVRKPAAPLRDALELEPAAARA
ncbi:hypothetical protein [Nocardia asiatica]|uniref:hypothetical protein n=1 Tax=Nocardia asiatica TaxID=209252 RepID=UPI003EE3A994